MHLTTTAWVESPNSRDEGRRKTHRSHRNYESLPLNDAVFFVDNKSQVKFIRISKHTGH
jgi:hypothetical protein